MAGKKPTRPTKAPARIWGLKDIEELLDLLAGREITEFEMKQSGVRIHIKRGNTHAGEPAPAQPYFSVSPSPDSAPQSRSAPASPLPPPAAVPSPVEAGESTEGLYIMKSPIVGTFYAAPSPNAPPFVKLGDVVQVGQVLCIIEAMKLMNDLESEVAGEIVRIYVENGQPVEYSQSLFAINPTHKSQ